MSKLVGIVAALVLAAVAVFDVAKESKAALGLGPVIVLLTFGVLMWALLSKIARRHSGRDSGVPINLALWLHSFFEGALAALSFSFGFKAGIVVSMALLMHLLPEALAIVATLKQFGFSYRYAIRTYCISLTILFGSFGLLRFVLPDSSLLALTILTTIVAGGIIYVAAAAGHRALNTD